MDLILVLLAVTAFPVGCLAFVLWMGVIEDSIPTGVRRAVHRPDPPPILAVPVRRTAVDAGGWWERVVEDADPAAGDGASAPDRIPEQRTPAAEPAPVLPAPVLPAPEPLAGT